jgi:adenosine deaminase
VVYVFAGEEGGPEYVWQALKVLGAQRIDHGIHSLEDPTLVEYMATHSIPITLCPISNHKLQVRHTHGLSNCRYNSLHSCFMAMQ